MSLKPEDYLEPACPLCMSDPTQENPVRRIDLQRMMQKLDEHLGRNDYVAALRHLNPRRPAAYELRPAACDRRGHWSQISMNDERPTMNGFSPGR